MVRALVLIAVAISGLSACQRDPAPVASSAPRAEPFVDKLVINDMAFVGGEPIAPAQPAVVHYPGCCTSLRLRSTGARSSTVHGTRASPSASSWVPVAS